LRNSTISAGLSGRRRGCRVAESRASCWCPAQARAFRDRRQAAGTARHPTGPVYRQAARPADRWWPHPEPPLRNSALAALGHSWSRGQAMVAPSEAAGSSRPAGLVRPPCSRSLPTSMRSKARVSLPFGGNGPRAQMFRYPIVARLTICETGSAKNAPSAASAAVRSG